MNQLLQRAAVAGVGCPLPTDTDAEGLRERLYGRPTGGRRAALDFAAMHKQLSVCKSPTLQQLWQEYREAPPEWYGCSEYCELSREWKARRSPVMLQEHKDGEKLFVDYAGQTVPVQDAKTGAKRSAEGFVAVLDCPWLPARTLLPSSLDLFNQRREMRPWQPHCVVVYQFLDGRREFFLCADFVAKKLAKQPNCPMDLYLMVLGEITKMLVACEQN